MEIHINLASRAYVDFRPFEKRLRKLSFALAALVVCLCVAVILVQRRAQGFKSRGRVLDQNIVSMRQEHLRYRSFMLRPENIEIVKETRYLNQVFDLKALSWTLVLKDLELVLPSEVEVSEIEPVRAQDGDITLRMRVIGPQDKTIDFVKNLEVSQHFLHPRISGEFARNVTSSLQHDEKDPGTMEVVILAEYDANAPQILTQITNAGPAQCSPGNSAGLISHATMSAATVPSIMRVSSGHRGGAR